MQKEISFLAALQKLGQLFCHILKLFKLKSLDTLCLRYFCPVVAVIPELCLGLRVSKFHLVYQGLHLRVLVIQ